VNIMEAHNVDIHLQTFIASAPDGDTWSVSCSGCFTPFGGGVLSNHSTGSYVGITPVWIYYRRENLLPPPETGPDSSVIQLTALPLCQLYYLAPNSRKHSDSASKYNTNNNSDLLNRKQTIQNVNQKNNTAMKVTYDVISNIAAGFMLHNGRIHARSQQGLPRTCLMTHQKEFLSSSQDVILSQVKCSGDQEGVTLGILVSGCR
jgi:hypothetical protein